jgi:FixJ family two-component response regulator
MKDKWVVVVDSDGEDCFILQEAFNQWTSGVSLDQYCSPEEFLNSARWKVNSPRVILLELILPGQDGLDWLPIFLTHECCQHTPVVVYSSLEVERQTCLKSGAADFIKKPSGFPDMKQVVDKVWQSWLID